MTARRVRVISPPLPEDECHSLAPAIVQRTKH